MNEPAVDQAFMDALEAAEPPKVKRGNPNMDKIPGKKKRVRKTPSNYKRAIIHSKGEASAAIVKTAKEVIEKTDDKQIQKAMRGGGDWIKNLTPYEENELRNIIIGCDYKMYLIHDAVWRRWQIILHDKALSDKILEVKIEEEKMNTMRDSTKVAIKMAKNRTAKNTRKGITPLIALSSRLFVIEDTMDRILQNAYINGGLTQHELNGIKGMNLMAQTIHKAYDLRMKGEADQQKLNNPKDQDIGKELSSIGR